MHSYMRAAVAVICLLIPFSQAQTDTQLVVSEDGNCGGTTGQTCLNSSFGNCCSGKGYCGSTIDYCNADCQTDFGACTVNSSSISSDGRCGSTDPLNQVCVGSTFGNCCSPTGWCGSTSDYCAVGCQSEFGECDGTSSNSTNTATTATTSVSSSSTQSSSASGSASSISSGVSSAASTSTADADAQAQSNSNSSTSSSQGMSTGAKAGVGVAVALVLLALIGAAIFVVLRRRRSRRNNTILIDEKADPATTSTSTSTIPVVGGAALHSDEKDSSYITESKKSDEPAELGDFRHGRAELGSGMHESVSELDSKSGGRGTVETVEMPSETSGSRIGGGSTRE